MILDSLNVLSFLNFFLYVFALRGTLLPIQSHVTDIKSEICTYKPLFFVIFWIHWFYQRFLVHFVYFFVWFFFCMWSCAIIRYICFLQLCLALPHHFCGVRVNDIMAPGGPMTMIFFFRAICSIWLVKGE